MMNFQGHCALRNNGSHVRGAGGVRLPLLAGRLLRLQAGNRHSGGRRRFLLAARPHCFREQVSSAGHIPLIGHPDIDLRYHQSGT